MFFMKAQKAEKFMQKQKKVLYKKNIKQTIKQVKQEIKKALQQGAKGAVFVGPRQSTEVCEKAIEYFEKKGYKVNYSPKDYLYEFASRWEIIWAEEQKDGEE